MILALEKRYENFTLGRKLTIEQIDTISQLARKHDFSLAGFRNFERAVTDEEIAHIQVLSNRNWQCVISEVDNKPTKNYNLT